MIDRLEGGSSRHCGRGHVDCGGGWEGGGGDLVQKCGLGRGAFSGSAAGPRFLVFSV